MIETRLINGKALALQIRKKVAAGVQILAESARIKPGLAVILVGNDPASALYVRNKIKATAKVGIQSFEYRLPTHTGMRTLITLIQQLNHDSKIHGILLQLPLPSSMDSRQAIEAIDPCKDVDGLHPLNAGRLTQGLSSAFVPCTPLGCFLLLRRELGSDLSGKKALVIGRSVLVGRPMLQLLLSANCTVTAAHSHTQDLPSEIQKADIVIAAIGKPEFIKGSWFKPGAVTIDVGINRIDGKNLVGDIDFAGAQGIAGAITPVPGGVGPMTIACLLYNTLKAASLSAGRPCPVEETNL